MSLALYSPRNPFFSSMSFRALKTYKNKKVKKKLSKLHAIRFSLKLYPQSFMQQQSFIQ